ncbi:MULTISPECIES: hypothetical protein [unclassified Methylobacterium]|uniref:DUF6894 family protein n=1 Tax=unclassified Methylobacterium TaxID=2615210 RepID=UPI0011C208B4|nr:MULTISPECIES: hypothetical protein [unclassified Methylobacterium]QEE37901.1 hypothetical protein FVA80_01940 [Methylobacterium sp. WL1]TXN59393.1 hypothetical protein FV241_02470 [Methylobacterium sp. WL2]
MPLFFINIRHRPGPTGLAVDPEGAVYADLNAARVDVLAQARAMIARERHTFIQDWMDCSFEIVDAAGQLVLTVPFSDTVVELEDWD